MKIETIWIRVGRDIEAATGEVARGAPEHDLTSATWTASSRAATPMSAPTIPAAVRSNNASRRSKQASDATAYSSGSAASLAVFSLLRPGDHVIAPIEILSRHGEAAARHHRTDGRTAIRSST